MDDTGRTPLHLALLCRQYALARQLVEAGAKVTLADNAGMTPLHVLVDNRFPARDLPTPADARISVPETLSLIDLLLAHGADINARNGKGVTPLGLIFVGTYPELQNKLAQKGGKI